MVSLDDRITMGPDVVYRSLGGEAILLNLETGIYFGLNESGTRIWELAEQHDLRTVCARLAAEFDAPLEVIERDVLELVSALVDKHLVQIEVPNRAA